MSSEGYAPRALGVVFGASSNDARSLEDAADYLARKIDVSKLRAAQAELRHGGTMKTMQQSKERDWYCLHLMSKL